VFLTGVSVESIEKVLRGGFERRVREEVSRGGFERF